MLNASIGQVYSNYWGAMTEEVFIGLIYGLGYRKYRSSHMKYIRKYFIVERLLTHDCKSCQLFSNILKIQGNPK